jgi:putative membrane protein
VTSIGSGKKLPLRISMGGDRACAARGSQSKSRCTKLAVTTMSEPVDNRGSMARDQLANERTFLAWVRTGLGFVGIGVVLDKLIEARGSHVLVLGLLFIAAGIAQLLYGLVRYRRISDLLSEGRYAPAHRGPLALVMLCVALALGASALMLI